MPAISVSFEPKATPGLTTGEVFHTTADWCLDALTKGMTSGRTSLMLRIPINDPEILKVTPPGVTMWVYAETSLRMWMTAARMLAARFRDELEDEEVGWAVVSPAVRQALVPRFAEAIRRSIPCATEQQAMETAGMLIDAVGADAPGGG